jgi:hypothetical protein
MSSGIIVAVTDEASKNLTKAARLWRASKAKERERMGDLYIAVAAFIAAGGSEVEAGKVAEIDRGTVRRALGKPRL